jgi:hypothetical protein
MFKLITAAVLVALATAALGLQQVKKLLLAATAVLALAGPAMAFDSNGTVMPTQPDDYRLDTSNLNGTDYVSLDCHPPIDRSDRDPVIETDVTLNFKPGSDQHLATFKVGHNLRSGRNIDRDTQYAGNVWKKAGYNEWYWNGRQYQNARVSMQGTVWRTASGQWMYQEIVYKDGFVDHVISAMHCNRSLGD